MRILVVNDDGIEAAGIIRLAALAKELGEVWVVAPDAQCSAMSQRITVRGELQLRKRADFPVEGVEAYSLSGTPADCVKVAVEYLMKDQLPDIVFSGINKGYNVGYEIAYSGTVGATWEAISKGIRAIAFSVDMEEDYAVTQAHWSEVTRELLTKDITWSASGYRYQCPYGWLHISQQNTEYNIQDIEPLSRFDVFCNYSKPCKCNYMNKSKAS